MDVLSFVAKIVEALAWPLALVTVVLLLRSEIKTLLRLLRKLRAGPVEAEFDREVQELKKEAAGEVPQPVAGVAFAEQAKLVKLAADHPRAAILEAWRVVEEALLELVAETGVFVSPRETSSSSAWVRALAKQGSLEPEATSLFYDLRGLRNRAAHDHEFKPSTDGAIDYVGLAGRLVGYLRARMPPGRAV